MVRAIVAAPAVALCVGAGILEGCAVVDQYSDRAVVYNLQAEQAQEQALLLNIVRAYLRRPMQFTTVSSITGTATAAGGTQYSLPTNVPFRPTTNGASIASFPPVPTWLFSGSLSGGPAFTVPVLDTQEFYRGLLQPIPTQVWDLYIQNTYPRDLLFNLFVEKIVIRRMDPNSCGLTNHQHDCELVIQNYVGEDAEIELFQIFSDYLLALGLTTESEKKPQSLLKPTKSVPAVNVNLNVRGVSGASGSTDMPSGGDGTKPYSLCFAPPRATESACVLRSSLCGAGRVAAQIALPSGGSRHCGSTEMKAKAEADLEELANKQDGETDLPQSAKVVGVMMSSDTVTAMQRALSKLAYHEENSELDTICRNLEFFRGRPVVISFYTRSVEAILYYLGEIGRRQTNPDFHALPRTIYFTNPSRYEDYPEQKCLDVDPNRPLQPHGRDLCVAIFVLETNAQPEQGLIVSTNYDGVVYSVPNLGSSGAVLDIVKQALALLSSAKSLPQSNVISVVGSP